MKAKVVTVDASSPLLEILAKRLLVQNKDNPMKLADTIIILPTRRACRSLKEAFIRLSEGKVLLLPRMLPVTNLEDTALFDGENIPPDISVLERKMILTRLIMAKSSSYGIENPTPEKAAMLADALADFLDEAYLYEIDLSCLKKLVPEDFATHWQEILKFLQIIIEEFPKILAEAGQINPSERQVKLLDAQAEKWQKKSPNNQIIAAGITGSIPAIGRLLKVIAKLPEGLVILPALDKEMDDESFDLIDSSHPQYETKILLQNMNLNRQDVQVWYQTSDPILKERERLVKEALRSASTTDKWREIKKFNPDVLKKVRKIECENVNQEALTIALALREVLETPAKRAMMVTSDRDLAQRVIAQMKRWDILLDDSAGKDITETPVGVFLRLVAEAASTNCEFRAMLALLKHPMAAAGMNPIDLRIIVRKWEKFLRDPQKKTKPIQWNKNNIDFSNLVTLFQNPSDVLFSDILQAHMELAEALAASETEPGPLRLWKGEIGQEAAALITEISSFAHIIGRINPLYYPALFYNLLKGHQIRPKFGTHPRLEILGPIEARLQKADLIIIAGLNEGVFPKTNIADPWLSRQMRAECGLPSIEAKIGIAAHDFIEMFCAPEVIMTRSLKNEGTPTVPSRWMLRIDTLLKMVNLENKWEVQNLSEITKKLDLPKDVKPCSPPEPCPPLEVRPRRLSVTEIETLMRDPYTIYAKHILKLLPLDDIDYEPGRAEYGTVLHNVFELFIKENGLTDFDNAKEKIIALAHKAFEKTGFSEATFAFWWPRFVRVAEWFLEKMKERNLYYHKYICETKGALNIPAPAGDFTLVAKVDRIDIKQTTNNAMIIDYKTGEPPSIKTIQAGYAPQLPLEAVMIQKNAFPELSANTKVEGMEFWKLSGTAKGSKIISFSKEETQIYLKDAYEKLRELIYKFDNNNVPYPASPRADMAPKYSDYEHLERVKEWSSGKSEGDDE